MWKLKGCPRCGGDLYLDRGLDSWFAQCLQCGYERELIDIREFRVRRERVKEPVLAKGRAGDEEE